MKLKTRIVVMTVAVLSLGCLLLYGWTSISTNTMVKNIRLLEDQKFVKLRSINDESQANQQRLLIGLGAVVLIGGGISWYGADLALRPMREMTKVVKDFTSQDLKGEIPLPKVRDERYELILAFNQMTHRLSQAFEREKRITANIAHEFRTPLAVLMTKYDILDMAKPESIEPYRNAIAVSKEKVEYLSQMTSRLLALYRETRPGQEEAFSLRQALEDLLRDYRKEAKEKDVTMRLSSPELTVQMDPLLFRQMVGNLIANGIRYNEPGGSLDLNVNAGSGPLEIQVRDTGIGITDQQKKMIFEPFYRADPSRSRASGGSGLGLAFSRMVAETYGGTIEVEDAQPRGSLFRLTLQLQQPSEN